MFLIFFPFIENFLIFLEKICKIYFFFQCSSYKNRLYLITFLFNPNFCQHHVQLIKRFHREFHSSKSKLKTVMKIKLKLKFYRLVIMTFFIKSTNIWQIECLNINFVTHILGFFSLFIY